MNVEVAADSDKSDISDKLRTELDRRMETYEDDPYSGVQWEHLRDRLMGSQIMARAEKVPVRENPKRNL